jgi:hypothetical protein
MFGNFGKGTSLIGHKTRCLSTDIYRELLAVQDGLICNTLLHLTDIESNVGQEVIVEQLHDTD